MSEQFTVVRVVRPEPGIVGKRIEVEPVVDVNTTWDAALLLLRPEALRKVPPLVVAELKRELRRFNGRKYQWEEAL